METVILTVLVFCLAFAGMALGVLFGREPVRGSCGGIACIPKVDCAACPRRRERE